MSAADSAAAASLAGMLDGDVPIAPDGTERGDPKRIVLRQPTDWFGTYRIVGDSEQDRRWCRVLDVSTQGAGLELFGTSPEAALEHRVVVSVQLRGDIRDAIVLPNSLVRVGIEFTDLTGAAESYVRTLSELGERW